MLGTQLLLGPFAFGDIKRRADDRRRSLPLRPTGDAIQPAFLTPFGDHFKLSPGRNLQAILSLNPSLANLLSHVWMDHLPEIHPPQFIQGIAQDGLPSVVDVEKSAVLMEEPDGR